MDAISVESITKHFKSNKKEFFALKDVSFALKEGEIFGLLGPNGAGKTTLINILTTVLLPDKGTARILGRDVLKNRYDILEIVNVASGSTVFHPFLKTKEIMHIYSKFYKLDRINREDRIKQLVERLEMNSILEKRFEELSSGQRIRVILAVSLLNYPKVLLLDEPTIGMDPDIAKKTRKLIKDINKKERTTILLTSLYMQEVEELCGRIAFINNGKILDIGEIKSLKNGKLGSEISIVLKDIADPELLRVFGFTIKGKNTITKRIQDESEIGPIMDTLCEKGYNVIKLDTKSPTLEEYFIRMMKK
ncbi:MAG: ABC transporter ATP-binding protein [archaeon]